jgi:hypothetical protein
MCIKHKELILLVSLVYILPRVTWADNHSLLTVGVGCVRIFDKDNKFFGSIGYRPSYRFYKVGPWICFEATDRDFYLTGGGLLDITLGKHYFLTPSLGVGVYLENDGMHLGSSIEFREAIEISYHFKNDARLGLSFSHVSNAGISKQNPGTEAIMVIYALPLNF